MQGAVEALDFAVLPRAVRLDEFVADVVLVQQSVDGVAVPVAPGALSVIDRSITIPC